MRAGGSVGAPRPSLRELRTVDAGETARSGTAAGLFGLRGEPRGEGPLCMSSVCDWGEGIRGGGWVGGGVCAGRGRSVRRELEVTVAAEAVEA